MSGTNRTEMGQSGKRRPRGLLGTAAPADQIETLPLSGALRYVRLRSPNTEFDGSPAVRRKQGKEQDPAVGLSLIGKSVVALCQWCRVVRGGPNMHRTPTIPSAFAPLGRRFILDAREHVGVALERE